MFIAFPLLIYILILRTFLADSAFKKEDNERDVRGKIIFDSSLDTLSDSTIHIGQNLFLVKSSADKKKIISGKFFLDWTEDDPIILPRNGISMYIIKKGKRIGFHTSGGEVSIYAWSDPRHDYLLLKKGDLQWVQVEITMTDEEYQHLLKEKNIRLNFESCKGGDNNSSTRAFTVGLSVFGPGIAPLENENIHGLSP